MTAVLQLTVIVLACCSSSAAGKKTLQGFEFEGADVRLPLQVLNECWCAESRGLKSVQVGRSSS